MFHVFQRLIATGVRVRGRTAYGCLFTYFPCGARLTPCWQTSAPGSAPTCTSWTLAQLTGRNRFGSIRFGSGLFENLSVRFASVRKITFPASTRFGLRFSDASWLGPIRFGSIPRPVPAGSRIKRFGSVRFGSVRSVRFGFLFLPVVPSRSPQKQGCECPPRGPLTGVESLVHFAYPTLQQPSCQRTL